MTKHSSIVGGSTADRLLNCPGSYQATQALPKTIDSSSEYAEEGTAMHAVMTHLMTRRKEHETDGVIEGAEYNAANDAYDCMGTRFYDRVLTQDHVETMIWPAINALEDLEAQYGGGFRVAAVEMTVRFPGIPGAFGTSDLLLVSDVWALMIDWKFGAGVSVKAVYAHPDGSTLNPQLAYYLTAAMATKPIHFNRRKLAVAIIQPRAEEPLTHTETSRKELKMFREDLENAVVTAIEHSPPRTKGEWCRFAPCKVNCPLWTGPLLDLSKLGVVTPVAPAKQVTAYAEYLVKAKTLVDMMVLMQKEIDAQMLAYIEAGGTIPGWRLKAKVKNRQWIDETIVNKELMKLGFKQYEIWQKKLQTFASVDAMAKRLGIKIPDHLRVAPPSNEVTLATTGDPAPLVDRGVAAAQFAAALSKLQG